ncbi:LysE family translocator [Paractinoplanes durhamensis]|nr:LysE family translocator [Actinoplanes durhamensis]
MMWRSVVAFWLVALLLISVPGADWAFVVGAGLRGAVRPAVAGLVTGYAAITLVVAAGVGALVAGRPAVLTGLTIVGGLYLMWHGAMTVARPAVPVAGVGGRAFAQGVGVSGLNPKGLLIFLALLPQFTEPSAALPIAVQIGVLGLAFILTCAGFYLIVGSLARTVLRARPAVARAVSRASGVAMVLVGAFLMVERLLSA